MKIIKYSLVLVFIIILLPSQSFADNTKEEELGKILYFDKNLSINRNQACASCHTPPTFVDPDNLKDPVNSVVSLGSIRTLNGTRNAQSAAYAAFSPFFHWDSVEGLYVGGQFWDGRANTLSEQAQGPFVNPVEMGMPNKRAVLERIADEDNPNKKKYKKLFKKVYKVDIDDDGAFDNETYVNAVYALMADAIAAFEKTGTFNQFSSKFDYFLAGMAELTPEEQFGLEVFNGKAQCNACHVSDPLVAPDGSVMPPMFTDFTYDNIGIPKSQNPLIVDAPVDLGLGGREDIKARNSDGSEEGKHKVMSLRNIGATPPYGHNGFFATLEDITHFYNTRDVEAWPAPEVPQNLNVTELGDLRLTPEEEAAVVAFMKTLTDGYGPPLNDFAFPPFP